MEECLGILSGSSGSLCNCVPVNHLRSTTVKGCYTDDALSHCTVLLKGQEQVQPHLEGRGPSLLLEGVHAQLIIQVACEICQGICPVENGRCGQRPRCLQPCNALLSSRARAVCHNSYLRLCIDL